MASRSIEMLRVSVGALLADDPHLQPDALVVEDTEVLLMCGPPFFGPSRLRV
jgi:hypothetical protein